MNGLIFTLSMTGIKSLKKRGCTVPTLNQSKFSRIWACLSFWYFGTASLIEIIICKDQRENLQITGKMTYYSLR